MASFKGTIKPMGMGIFMQGSHQLVDDDGNVLALLESESADLSSFVNKKVEVTGTGEPSVEGGATLVKVDSVKAV